MEQFTDFAISGRGIPLDLTHTYSSIFASTNGPLGYGWTFSYNMSLSVDAAFSTVTVHQENGAEVTFTHAASGYTAPPRVAATLSRNSDGTFLFTRAGRDTFTFSTGGQLTSERDPNGYLTAVARTPLGDLLITEPGGRKLILSFAGDHLSTAVDPMGRSVAFGYDGQGNLSSVTDAVGGRTAFTYDENHLLLSRTDPLGHVTRNAYDGSGRLVKQVDALGDTTTLTYNGDNSSAAGGSTLTTDPTGSQTLEQYRFGLRMAVTTGFGTPQAAVTTYQYDPATLGITSLIDPDGHASTMTYDSKANMTSRQDAMGDKTVASYDEMGDLISDTDPDGITTTYRYDRYGNLLSAEAPLLAPGGKTIAQRVTAYVYGDASHPGDVTSVIDPDGHATTYTYDRYGNRASTTDPLGDRTTSEYNTAGWIQSTVFPRGNFAGGDPKAFTTSYTYDRLGDVTSVIDPVGDVTISVYDGNRNLVSSTDADGMTTTYTYDAVGKVVSVRRPDGSVERTVYDADERTLQQIDAAGHATTYAYDARGEQTKATDALGRSTVSTYDLAGLRTSVLEATGAMTRYGYDLAGRLVSIAYSDGTTPDIHIAYDSDGQRIAMTDGSGTSTWAWDSLNRMVAYTDGSGQETTYGHDLAGNVTAIGYPNGNSVLRGFDAAGRLTSVTDWLGNTSRFTYDADSQVAGAELPAGSGVTDSFAYDHAGRFTEAKVSQGPDALSMFRYTRDGNGQVTSEHDAGPDGSQTTYTYTALNELSAVDSAAYTYDSSDNITALANGSGLSYDFANELQALTQGTNSAKYTYDASGDRTSASPGSGSVASYKYDEANRLIASNGDATYQYNGDGLRVAKVVNGVREPFVWDVADATPALLLQDGPTSFIYGPEGLPLEQISADGSLVWFHHDQLGSTRLLTTATGQVAAAYSYDPYGGVTSNGPVTGIGTHLLFAGEYQDAETGFYYLRARSYDPNTAQFLSRDPLVSVTKDPYLYVAGNPLNAQDPSGDCGLDFFQACDPRCPDSVQPLGPWQCSAAAGLIVVNKTYIAPVAKTLKAPIDAIAFGCAVSFVGEMCGLVASGISNYLDLSLLLAGCEEPSDAFTDAALEVPGFVLPGLYGQVSDVATSGYSVAADLKPPCPASARQC